MKITEYFCPKEEDKGMLATGWKILWRKLKKKKVLFSYV
jgi:hypothetical protein